MLAYRSLFAFLGCTHVCRPLYIYSTVRWFRRSFGLWATALYIFHRGVVWDADATSLPSGENTTAVTQSECPSRVCSVAPGVFWLVDHRSIYIPSWGGLSDLSTCGQSLRIYIPPWRGLRDLSTCGQPLYIFELSTGAIKGIWLKIKLTGPWFG